MNFEDVDVEVLGDTEEESVEQEYTITPEDEEGVRVGVQAIRDILHYNGIPLKPKFYALAFGGATHKLASKLYKRGVKTIYINSDTTNFNKVDCSKKIRLGNYHLGYHKDAMGIRKIGEVMMEADQIQVYEEIKDANAVVLIGNAGGGTAGGAMLQFLKFLKKQPTPMAIVVVVILPFSAEGRRRRIALQTLEEIRNEHDAVIVIDNDTLPAEEKVLTALSRRDEKIVEITLRLKKKTEEAFYEKLRKILPSKHDIRAIVSGIKVEVEKIEKQRDDVVVAG